MMSPVVFTHWRLVDDHWKCVNDSSVTDCLADYLWHFGFSIPEEVKYCLATSSLHYELKYRVYGGHISVFINPLKPLK